MFLECCDPLWITSTSHLFSQVHGKNLYLAFVAAEGPLGPTAEETALQRGAACGARCPAQGQQGQAGAPQPHSQDEELQEPQHSRSEAPEAAEGRGNWLRIHFGMFGSVRANEFSRASRANKRGDWKDPVPRYFLFSFLPNRICVAMHLALIFSDNF